MDGPDQGSLWRNRDFNIFWLGQALSVLGDSFSMVATPLLVLQVTGSIERMGQLTAVTGIGMIAAGLLSGVLVDRFDRRRLMIVCDCARTVLWLSVPFAWWLGHPSMALLFVTVILGALFGNTFQVASITAVANLARRDQIADANGRLHATFALMTCVGPMLSGWVCHRFGPVVSIGIDASTFGISAISLVFVRLRRSSPVAKPQALSLTRLRKELIEGAQFMWEQPVLRAVSLLLCASNLFIAARNDLLIFHVKHTLGRTDADVGTLFGIGALGAVFAGLVAPALRRRFGFAVCWLSAGFLVGISVGSIGMLATLSAMALTMTIVAFSDSIRGINSMTFRQEITPDHLLGRVTSVFWMLINLSAPIGAALTTAVAAQIGSGPTISLIGAMTFAITGVALFTAIREVKPGSLVPPASEAEI